MNALATIMDEAYKLSPQLATKDDAIDF